MNIYYKDICMLHALKYSMKPLDGQGDMHCDGNVGPEGPQLWSKERQKEWDHSPLTLLYIIQHSTVIQPTVITCH